MQHRAHKNGGIIFSALTILIFYKSIYKSCNYDDVIILSSILAIIFGGIVGGLLPDLDLPNSKAAKSLGIFSKILSVILNKLFGHRMITHTILFNIFVPFVLCLLSKYISIPIKIIYLYFVLGIFLGISSHLFLDSLTEERVKLFYPFTSKKFGIGIINKKNKKRYRIFIRIISYLQIILIGYILFSIFYLKY